ncbi:Insulin receptor substrate 1-B, partial [Armadillidium nasatum]
MQQKILLSHYSFNGLSFITLIEKTMAFFFHGNSQKSQSTSVDIEDHVVKKGNLTKKKNMKTRYYVLKSESDDLPARLECYESEEKFLKGNQPKKKYILKDCFNISNISRKTDKNDQHIIALYINKDCISLLAENEEDMQNWVKLLKFHKNSNPHYPNLKIEYEHVWQVEVLPRSLALNQELTGQHFLCLTNWFLSLVRVSDPSIKKEFQLSSIRKCGTYDQFFLLVLGRYSGIGSGELFLQTEDSFIAQNIYHSVCSAMSNFGQMMHSSDGNIRQRTISDPQSEFPMGEGRVRSDSVPSSRKNIPNRKGQICSSHDKIQHQTSETQDNIRFSSRFEGFSNQIPDRNTSDTGDNPSNYLNMNLPRGTLGDSQENSDMYVEINKELEIGERHAPAVLNIPSRTNPSSHTEVLSNVCSALQNMSSPVSPSSVGSMTQWRTSSVGTPSPSQTSSAAHSRNASLLEESYVPMTSPGSQGPHISFANTDTSSQYIEMGPGPSANITQTERPRSISTPTPIPSPSDEDSCETFNSGSSSCASGTPSDTRIHDLAGEERGDTAYSYGGIWGNSLSPNYIEDNDCVGGPRPLRTNSVGSKPDQFKRKNRLDSAVPVGESARVRAFSVGSRVSLKLGVGRHGCGSAHHGAEHPTGGLGEIFPSIKEYGKQAKSKSTSAPMLGVSPISHSWSGTPGVHFRGLAQNRNFLRESNLMELDFSKNKSCDYIPSEDKDKERKTNKDRLWSLNPVTGNRYRSNSKSSGGSSHGAREKRTSESESSSRGLDIPYLPNDRNDYQELDFTPSPRSTNSDHMKGYLPMHPPHLSSSLKTTSEFIIEKRAPRTSSFNESTHDMSSSLSSCASNDGYVDMTRGGASNGALTIASSSSSSNSINTPPIGGGGGGGGSRTRRTSSGIFTSVTSSQELPSPMEDLMKDEEIEACLGELKKSKKKGSKRRSFRDSSKKKKNDSGGGDSPEVQSKSKSQGPFATLTNLIIRKPNSSSSASSSSHKTPLSPKGSPLPPKVNKDSSPFSSLTRSKSKGMDLFSEIGEERESSSLSEDIIASSPPPPISPQNSSRRRTLGGLEISPIPPYSVYKGDEKMLLSPLEGKLIRQGSTNSEVTTTEEKRKSAYSNLDDLTCSAGSLPSLNIIQKGVTNTTKPVNFVESRNYVNMQPGSSSPQLSPPATDSSSPKPSFENLKLTVVTKPPPTDNYMMMDGGEQVKETHVPSLPSAVAKRPEIPPTLLSNHSQRPVTLAAFEKLSLKEEKPLATGVSTERSRSHSGPGAPEGTKGIILKKADDERASSACSSPISYSPPTSPTLGSVSSMSSLSEGGLSSASSTCTVVNVGLKHSSSASNASKSSSLSTTTTIVITNTTASLTTTSTASTVTSGTSQLSAPEPSSSTSCSSSDSQKPSSSLSATKNVPAAAAAAVAKPSNEDESLNYVALDLGKNRSNKSPSPRMASKNFYSAKKSNSDDVPLSYVEIDFKKSEGLRN